MIELYLKDTDELLGSITEAELQYLIDSLEETSEDDQDYFVDRGTIDYLADGRATDHLVALLEKAVGDGDGVEVRWEKR
jgi:processive 1,2-diacylglycerol beta-glucosyltransferase